MTLSQKKFNNLSLSNLNANLSATQRVPHIQIQYEIHIWSHTNLKLWKKMTLMIWCTIYFANCIHSFSLFCTSWDHWSQNQISKTNQPYDAQLADCCYFFPSFYWHFFPPFRLSSWSCSFLATRVPVDQTRCSRQHTSPLSASWNIHGQPGTAAQHSTAPRCTDQRPLIYLFISSPCCQAV